MTYTIADGSQVTINVGNQIQVIPGYLPASTDGQWIPVVKADSDYPYWNDGHQQAAITPSIITAVQ